MREIFVESEHQEFPCPPGFVAPTGERSLGEPVEGGRSRAKPLFMHRLLAPDDLTQEALFVYRNWKSRRCFPNPARPQSPLWWVVDGESEHFVLVEGERHRARLTQIPSGPLFELPEEATLCLPVANEAGALSSGSALEVAAATEDLDAVTEVTPAALESLEASVPSAESDRVFEPTERDPVAADGLDDVESHGDLLIDTWSGESPPPEPGRVTDRLADGDGEALVETAPPEHETEDLPPHDDPFRRSLDAVLAELTAPVTVDAERESRVAVRVTTTAGGLAAEGPLMLPSRPELVSSDFLAHTEVSRPALVAIDNRPAPPPPRVPPRAFALVAGVLVLFVTLAVWLFR
jgi:hypothetical protein